MRYVVTLNGKKYEVDVDGVNAVVNPDGPPSNAMPNIVLQQDNSTEQVQNVQAGDGTPIESPLPGKIVDIKVSIGSKVEPTDVVVLLEAMKMENEIKAGISGTVTGIAVTKGAHVETHDILLTIK